MAKQSSKEEQTPRLSLPDLVVSYSPTTEDKSSVDGKEEDNTKAKRICFLYDCTLTAYLMMGNLSADGLKTHAITMFEVGKLTDESIDDLLSELEKVSTIQDDREGEARPYFEHALNLRSMILALRHGTEIDNGMDLVKIDRLRQLDSDSISRMLSKNNSLILSMVPLSKGTIPITTNLPHLGPATPEVNNIWFKLFLYHITGEGPPSLLLTGGTRLRILPSILRDCESVLVTSWGHEPTIQQQANILGSLNDALTHAPVLVQAFGVGKGAETRNVPFPLDSSADENNTGLDWKQHNGLNKLKEKIDLNHTCGYVTFAQLKPPVPLTLDSPPHIIGKHRPSANDNCSPDRPQNGFHSEECVELLCEELDNLSPNKKSPKRTVNNTSKDELSSWTLLDCCFGVPLFNDEMNRYICDKIVNSLAKPDKLKKIKNANKNLAFSLKSFIANFHNINGKENDSIPPNTIDLWPRFNLVFSEGKLSKWDDK